MLDRISEYLSAQGRRHFRSDERVWVPYQKMAIPYAPVHQSQSPSPNEVTAALKMLPVILARWTDGIDSGMDSEWYAVVCNTFSPVDGIQSSNTRSKVRRGLSRFRIDRLEKAHAQDALGVYLAAHSRYQGSPSPRIENFKHEFEVDFSFPDLVEYWGAWRDETLLAYSRNQIWKNAADYGTIKFDPTGLRDYSSYALIYRMNEHYLKERGFRYVNDGYRSILHETEFQSFLKEKFGFRNAHTQLHLRYRYPAISAAITLAPILQKIDARFTALATQHRIWKGR